MARAFPFVPQRVARSDDPAPLAAEKRSNFVTPSETGNLSAGASPKAREILRSVQDDKRTFSAASPARQTRGIAWAFSGSGAVAVRAVHYFPD